MYGATYRLRVTTLPLYCATFLRLQLDRGVCCKCRRVASTVCVYKCDENFISHWWHVQVSSNEGSTAALHRYTMNHYLFLYSSAQGPSIKYKCKLCLVTRRRTLMKDYSSCWGLQMRKRIAEKIIWCQHQREIKTKLHNFNWWWHNWCSFFVALVDMHVRCIYKAKVIHGRYRL